jgi:predicted outer membrane repeat protein
MQVPSLLRGSLLHQRLTPSARRRREKARPASCVRPWLDVLEDRSVPSTWNVTSPSDDVIDTSDKNAGTLRFAVAHAVAGDKIVLKGAALGGITLIQGELKLTQTNLMIQGPSDLNPVTISGGGASRVFEISSGASVTMKDLLITSGNAQVGDPTDPHEGRGGGVVVDEGSILKMTGCTITNCFAPMIESTGKGGLGGGIADYGTLTMTNCSVIDNSALYTFGGGIAVFSGAPFSDLLSASLAISNSTVSGNTANANGGGICGVASTISIDNCDVTDNRAVFYDGGGLYNHGGTMTITSSRVTGNSAFESGGGITNYYSTADVQSVVTISKTDISGNKSLYSAGGAGIDNLGTLTLKDSTVTGNVGSYGGGIYNGFYGTATLKNVVLTGNNAYEGGAIDSFGALTLTGCQLSANTAIEQGGAIQAFGVSTTITNSDFSNNSADGGNPDNPTGWGGGLEASGEILIRNCSFTGNAAGHGGAIVFGGGNLTVARTTLSDNTAMNGGAMYVNGGTTALISSKLAGNAAIADGSGTFNTSGNGGAIYMSGGALWVSGSTKVINNTAATAGGGIFVPANYTVSVAFEDQSRVVNNTAPDGAGMDVCIQAKTVEWAPEAVFYLQGNSKLGDVSNGGIVYQDQDSTSTIVNLYGNPVTPI